MARHDCALHTPEERFPSGAPKEEFGWKIFEKNLPLGDCTKVQSITSAAAHGDEAWCQNV